MKALGNTVVQEHLSYVENLVRSLHVVREAQVDFTDLTPFFIATPSRAEHIVQIVIEEHAALANAGEELRQTSHSPHSEHGKSSQRPFSSTN